ncbi:MAG: PIN domain nuclease [Gallionellaceae bacterium]
MILVDSSVWIDGLRGAATPQVAFLQANIGQIPIVIGDLILTEVLQGITNEAQARQTEKYLLKFPVVELGGEKNAIQAAHNFRHLRAKGFTIRKTIDLLIATWCIANDVALLHNDRDFDPFELHLSLRTVK